MILAICIMAPIVDSNGQLNSHASVFMVVMCIVLTELRSKLKVIHLGHT